MVAVGRPPLSGPLTATATFRFIPATDAVTVVEPTPFPVTTPLELTEATAGFSLDHPTGFDRTPPSHPRTVAEIMAVSPTSSVTLAGDTARLSGIVGEVLPPLHPSCPQAAVTARNAPPSFRDFHSNEGDLNIRPPMGAFCELTRIRRRESDIRPTSVTLKSPPNQFRDIGREEAILS